MRRWWWLVGLLCSVLGMRIEAQVIPLESGHVLISSSLTPPEATAPWQAVQLPSQWQQQGASYGTPLWYRFEFVWPERSAQAPTVLYIPYLNNGGVVILNGRALARMPGTDEHYVVRWVQPQFIPIPMGFVRPGRNTLFLYTVPREFGSAQQLPVLQIGVESELRSRYEWRSFLVRTIPLITVAASSVIALLLLLIWWRRPQEQLYGILGLSTLLWGVRTLTLVLEFMPVDVWPLWRVIYNGATGGFCVTLAWFVLRFSGVKNLWLERALILYWIAGPMALMIDVELETPFIVDDWTLGLLLIACATLALSAAAALQQRTWQALALCGVLSLALLAGIHDFLVDRNDPWLLALAPDWMGRQIFLLHHAANLLLLVLAGIVTTRFALTLDGLEDLNATLQQRIAMREQQLAENYRELSRLSRARAIEEERERLVRDMHDGLGSQLVTSLSRVQRSTISQQEISIYCVPVLRRCDSPSRRLRLRTMISRLCSAISVTAGKRT
jgi:signal transduction histidine kinase